MPIKFVIISLLFFWFLFRNRFPSRWLPIFVRVFYLQFKFGILTTSSPKKYNQIKYVCLCIQCMHQTHSGYLQKEK